MKKWCSFLKVRISTFLFLVLIAFCGLAQEDITAMEYFIDTDPGPGNGTSVTITPGQSITESFSIATDALSPGYHMLGIRILNAQNRWSMYERRLFLIQDTQDDLNFPQTASNIQAAEYFVDTDPGVGNGTAIATSGGATILENISINTDALSPGYHLLGVRTQNTQGRWSMYERRLFLIQDLSSDLNFPQAVSNIQAAEYFIDTDPGVGNGTAIATSGGATILENISINTDALSPGYHLLGVRTQNTQGRWSMYENRLFLIQDPSSDLNFPRTVSNIQAAEYFIDTDPGIGNGTAITTSGGTTILENISINTDALSPGYHLLGVRAQNAEGRWSIYERRLFLIQDPQNDLDFPKAVSNIIQAEYFIDTDPGDMNGTPITTSGGSTINESLSISTDALAPGYHILGVRARNEDDSWGMYERRLFFIQDPQDDLGFPGTPSPITELEYFIDEDPGIGNGVNVPLDMPLDLVDITDLMAEIDPELSPGTHLFSIRAKNENGSWGLVETASFEVTNASTPVLTSSVTSPTNNAEIPVDLSFGQEMTGFDETDIVTLLDEVATGMSLVRTGSLVDNANGDYSFIVDAVEEGEVAIAVPNEAASASSDGTASLASDTLRIEYDITAPVVTVNSLSTTEVSPELTGTIDDLTSTVEVEVDGNIYSATINPDNTWSIPQGTIANLAIGTYDIIATATDLAGNAGTDDTANELVINSTNPLPVIAYTGSSITNQTPWNISVDFGAEVTGFEETDIVTLLNDNTGSSFIRDGSLSDNGNGSFEFIIDPVEGEVAVLIPDGVATSTSDGAASLASDTLRIEYDITAPVVTASELSTAEASPELTGTVDDLTSTVEVEVDGNIYSATINPDNTWSIPQGTIVDLAIGTYDVVATATDPAGNEGTDATTDELEITSPSSPLPVISYSGNGITNQAPWNILVDFGVEVTGFEEADIVTLLNDNTGSSFTRDGSLVDNGNGSFDFIVDPIEGEIDILLPEAAATATSDGGTSQASDTLRIVYDITSPGVTVTTLSTTEVSPELTGTIDDLTSTVEVEVDGNIYSAAINPDNTWSIPQETIVDLAVGTYEVIATALDLAGNEGIDNTTNELEILESTSDGISEADSLALEAFYLALDGENWTNNSNWLTDDHKITDWFGITLNDEENEIIAIGLPSNNLSGIIPSNIDQLTSLEVINLSGNDIQGLEADLSTFANATNIDLSGNQLDFGDLESVASISALNYANQQDIEAIDQGDLEIRVGTDQPLTTTTAGTANLFQWTFNGENIENANDPTYTISNMDISQVGTYGVVVSNSIVSGLELGSSPINVLGTAVVTVSAVENGTPISDNINAYLFSLNESVADTLEFLDDPNFDISSDSYPFPAILLGNYLVGVESVEPFLNASGDQIPGAFIPSYFGDVFLSQDAEILSLEADIDIDIEMQTIPTVDTGEGLVSGIVEEDFPEETERIDARRAAKKRKCGLRRRRTGGRIGQNDEFELIAYGETNDNGEFEYGFLPQGIYRFFVEYPGIPLDESAFVEFEIGEAGVTDDTFVLAVFVSPEGIKIEIVLGITSDYFVDFNIYPNPTSDIVNIEYSEIKVDRLTMEIISVDGQVLYSKELNRSRNKIQYDTSLLPSGQYLLRFSGNSGKEHLVYRIIKK